MMCHTQPNIPRKAKSASSDKKPSKVSGVKLYQLIFTDEHSTHSTARTAQFTFDETKFNKIFKEEESKIFEYSKTPKGTYAFNMTKKNEVWQHTRDINKEITSIPPIIKECAETILKYFLKNHLFTPNVSERQDADDDEDNPFHWAIEGMYEVISFAIIEFFLTMHEWDDIFEQIHRNSFAVNASLAAAAAEAEAKAAEAGKAAKYDPYILQDVKRFITGMVSRFRIEPANPQVSQEISDMMNLVIREIVRSLALYGGKMRNRSINKRMKRRTAKCKRMKRRTVKRIKRSIKHKRMKRRTKMHKKKC